MWKNKKKRNAIVTILIVLTVLLSAGIVAYNKMNEVVAETLITKIAASSAGDSTSPTVAENVYDSMSDTDQDVVKEIAEDHVSPTAVAEVTELLINDDTEGLKEYAYENLSESEIADLQALYDKYK